MSLSCWQSCRSGPRGTKFYAHFRFEKRQPRIPVTPTVQQSRGEGVTHFQEFRTSTHYHLVNIVILE